MTHPRVIEGTVRKKDERRKQVPHWNMNVSAGCFLAWVTAAASRLPQRAAPQRPEDGICELLWTFHWADLCQWMTMLLLRRRESGRRSARRRRKSASRRRPSGEILRSFSTLDRAAAELSHPLSMRQQHPSGCTERAPCLDSLKRPMCSVPQPAAFPWMY